MNIVVSRLEKYPAEEPTGWAVGFTAEASNGRAFYIDTVVPFDTAEGDDAALDVALEVLGDGIKSRLEALEEKSAIIGLDVSDKLSQ